VERPSSEWKFHRAQEHFSAFDMAAQWWLKRKTHRIVEEIDDQADVKQILLVADEQPPLRLSLIAGDAIQNMRSALDHLVVELATAEYGGPLPHEIESKLAFPITTCRDKFRAARKRSRLTCVPARAQAVIQRLQPYRRGDYRTDLLWVLQELSNIDKHRRLPLLNTLLHSVKIERFQSSDVRQFSPGIVGPFKEKTVILSWSPSNAEVDVELGPILIEIAFGEGTPVEGQPVTDTFNALNRYVAAVADQLADVASL
jgi:hypothetical protein